MIVSPNTIFLTVSMGVKIKPDHLKNPSFSLTTWCKAHWRGILSEFLSTLMLILLGCMSCVPVPGIDTSIYAPFAFGCVVMFNIQIFGHISGAFMNPTVTLASVIWGSTSIGLGVAYVVAECVGAVLGYGILIALSPIDLVSSGVCVTKPYTGVTVLQTLGIEICITAALSFICMSVWDPVNEHKQDSTAIKFGVTILGLSFVAGSLTGASMNPARSLGPAVWTGQWTQHWAYWVGPLTGSGLAAVMYKYVFFRRLRDEGNLDLNNEANDRQV
ncbi:hypothetical protein PYW08_001516 [Mythimna loreyi]|uniref:Uncharacterized protein n=1 Tax=Mythimna loreyi TaxID=667449 RepID=A0ACC2R4F8_9NEOP|nr:hypothetical protein PYW08_001516 [Mythimna loreyi]